VSAATGGDASRRPRSRVTSAPTAAEHTTGSSADSDETSALARTRTTEHGGRQRYGSREQNPAAYRQLDHELDTIERLGFPGVQFQHRSLPAEDG
jgi:hypothetical protein